MVFATIGCAIGNLFNYSLYGYGWYHMFVYRRYCAYTVWPLLIHLPRLALTISVFDVESPQFFIEKGDGYPSDEELDIIRRDLERFYEEEDANNAAYFITNEFHYKKDNDYSFKNLFLSKNLRKRLISGIVVNLAQSITGGWYM